MKKSLSFILAILTGTINIMLGSCGGIVAIETLKMNSVVQNKSHATAIAVIFPLTLISSMLYIHQNKVKINEALIFILPGIIGSITGAFILKKINNKLLSKAFSAFIIYSGIRMFLK